MNTPTIIRNTSAQWLRSGIAITGALLISGAVTLGLANRAGIDIARAAPAASVSAGQERFAALKQAQAELRDATFVPAPAVASGRERFAALKDRQAEARDATVVPLTALASSPVERFAAFKQRQVDQIMDAAMGNVIVPVAPVVNERFAALKDRQAKLHDAAIVLEAAPLTARERFAALKQAQAELRDGSRR